MGARAMVGRRGFTYTELLCVMTIVLVLWMLILPNAVRARNRADHSVCLSNLRNIYWALQIYAHDHDGHFPPVLTALTPRYLYDREVYRCPRLVAAEKHFPKAPRLGGPNGVDYAYAAGLAHDDHPLEPVAWDLGPWHWHGANVLYLSGGVRHIGMAELKRLNEQQAAAATEAGP